LNFLHEIDNAEKTREYFKDDPNVHIPLNYKQFSSDRVITQEFVYGVKVIGVGIIESLDK
jgi:predicted unusual protein kinase regulating ubiquinone biosynthesis (AarF/ABC1/UbiB family)